MKVTIEKKVIDLKLDKIKSELQTVALQAAAEGARSCLEHHFLKRQKEPRKDGFPKQGFWYGNNGFSVYERMRPTKYEKASATISIDSAALAHKLNPNPPPIVPGKGKKYLTLPAHASAVGKRARDFANLSFAYVDSKGRQGKNATFPVLLNKDNGTVFFYLARKVNTPHDPNALPTIQALQFEAKSSAEKAISRLLK